MSDLHCPICDGLLRQIDEVPEPGAGEKTLRFDILCPECGEALSVIVQINLDNEDNIVQKRVERRNE